LFNPVRQTKPEDIEMAYEDAPTSDIDPDEFGDGMPVTRLITAAGLEPSASAAARLVKGGGFYVNDERIANEKEKITRDRAIGDLFVLRKGQRSRVIVRLRKKRS
jgi:tyrosyl-tRNA synthetase